MAETGADWTTNLLDRLDHFIDVVRTNTTDRAVKVARAIVFGLVTAIVGILVAVLAVIMLVRVLNVILPSGVWLPYLVLGAIFLGVGVFTWRKATTPAPAQ